MKYYERNKLVIEYPTQFLGSTITARRVYPIVLTELGAGEMIKFIEKAQIRDKRGYKSRQNLILIDLHCSKEKFIDEISRYFSKKLNVNPYELGFRLLKPTIFGDLNVKS